MGLEWGLQVLLRKLGPYPCREAKASISNDWVGEKGREAGKVGEERK